MSDNEVNKTKQNKNSKPPDDIGDGLFEDESGMSPNSAFAHLYRGEIHRMKLWRERMDKTTHWAIISLFGILTWVFSSSGRPHYLLLFGVVVITIYAIIEGRRYKGYEMWHQRIRKLQRNVFSSGFSSDTHNDANWQSKLADSYAKPSPNISTREAVTHRFKQVYGYLISILLMSWFINVFVISNGDWHKIASIGTVSGFFILAIVVIMCVLVVLGFLYPYNWSSDEELL
jgi:uncharacterized membrane protein